VTALLTGEEEAPVAPAAADPPAKCTRSQTANAKRARRRRGKSKAKGSDKTKGSGKTKGAGKGKAKKDGRSRATRTTGIVKKTARRRCA
jgi:hypothetical protein